MLLEPIPSLGFLLGPCDYSASTRQCLCACLSQSVCVFLSVSQNTCFTKFGESVHVCAVTRMTCLELKARLSEGSEFLKQVWAHLVVIGRRKKGPCVLGTGSKSLTQPSITQPSPVQYSAEPANTKGKKHQQQDCSPSCLPTYSDSWPILIIPQQSPWQRFSFFFFINTVQSFPIPSISI